MGKSLYSGNVNGRLIYGYKKKAPCCVDDVCLTGSLIQSFSSLLTQVHSAVTTLFPSIETKSTFVANIRARACIPDPFFARVLWTRTYLGEAWTGTRVQILQLLDIYLQNGLSYKGDKLFDTTLECLPGSAFPQTRAVVEEKTALDSKESVLKEVGDGDSDAVLTSGNGAGTDGDADGTADGTDGAGGGSGDDRRPEQ